MPDQSKPDRDLSKLDRTLRRKLEAVLCNLAGHGVKLFVTEGYRTVERQQWLYAQGRTRKGPIVTKCDGVHNKSAHQSGRAADIAFRGGKLYPPGDSPAWKLLASSAKAHGLVWGGTWKFADRPHLELPGADR
jgi:D-alanyl-D-alanine dipeptidase